MTPSLCSCHQNNHINTSGLGFTVFAGCLLADKAGDGAEELRKLASPKLHVIQLDVTKQGDWDKCKEYINKNTWCGEY